MQYTRFPPKGCSGAASSAAQNDPPVAGLAVQSQTAVPDALPAAGEAPAHLHRLTVLLMVSIVTPIVLNVGGLYINPSRFVLLLAFLPAFLFWVSGKAGQIRTADIMVLLCAIWTVLAMLAVEGLGRLQYAAIVAIEMLTPYLIARCYIRGAADYAALIRFLRWIAIFLVPAAMVEALTTKQPYAMLLDPFFNVFGKADYEFRMGMSRAQVVFEHPILYGVYVATFCAPVYMLARAQGQSPARAAIFVAPIILATFFSLSSGAYLGLTLQALLILWGFMFRKQPRRWTILAVVVALGYVVVDLISNRTPFEVFISYLTFNSGTSYARVLIFEFGIQNVWARPLFGMGLGDWDRPVWMAHGSVDNFWLLTAMRYGIPAFLFIAFAFGAVLTTMMRARPASETAEFYRLAHIFSLIGLIIAICTVHLWSATFVFMMFMLGAGMWVADAPQLGKAASHSVPDSAPVKPRGGASTGSKASDQSLRRVLSRPAPRPPATRS